MNIQCKQEGRLVLVYALIWHDVQLFLSYDGIRQ